MCVFLILLGHEMLLLGDATHADKTDYELGVKTPKPVRVALEVWIVRNLSLMVKFDISRKDNFHLISILSARSFRLYPFSSRIALTMRSSMYLIPLLGDVQDHGTC